MGLSLQDSSLTIIPSKVTCVQTCEFPLNPERVSVVLNNIHVFESKIQ